MTIDLNHALKIAEDCARHAGTLLREALQQPVEIHYKDAIDLVTAADRQSEAVILRGLLHAFPDHHITGEEGGGTGAPRETAPYRWYIDPLDGTTNFAHGIPHFSVSIALADSDDRPLVGVVYDPVRDECFRATRGGGAVMNQQSLRVSAVSDLGRAVLVSGFPYDRWTNPDNNTAEWTNFILRSQDTRRTGSASLDLAYVAAGRFDGFWEKRLNAWDVMAGLLLVSEAGGQIGNYQGQEDGVYTGREVVASNGLIHEAMLGVITLGHDAPRPGRPPGT